MPTDDGNGANPTATANASVLGLTPEQLAAHPHVQELKKKFSDAHVSMDKTNTSKKELLAELAKYKTLAGVEDEVEVTAPDTGTVTKAELKEQIWELKYARDVDLYGDDEYKNDLKAGIPREYALKTAKLRFQSNPDKARLERQQSMASGSSVSDRNLDDNELTDADRKNMALWGYSEETAKKHKALKKSRGQA